MSSFRIRALTCAGLAVGAALLLLSRGEATSAGAAELSTRARPLRTSLPAASGATLVAELGCAGCHAGVGSSNDARAKAPALDDVGARRSPGFLFAYLANPTRIRTDLGRTRMPDFHLDERERLALTLYLGTLRASGGAPSAAPPAAAVGDAERLDAAYERVRTAHPEVTAAIGERIFVALNCAGCHAQRSVAPWRSGPDLSTEGSRVKPEWLRAFLATPHAVRPFGAQPGTGSRMPDFHLTPDEVDSLTAYLRARRATLPSYAARPLSVFARHEVESLLREKLPCLGCHQLGDEGGRIGPDLSNVRDRLRPAYIHAMITDPRHTTPGTIMPKTPMPSRTIELVAAYLITRAPTPSAPAYLSLVDNPPRPPSRPADNERTATALYRHICANCHGASGDGDGWNARYLPVRPTAHASAAYMSTRPDGTIYDGIAAGGLILGRSNRMPAFGEMLSRTEIHSLVAYIRTLCDCQGPAWSRDGVGAAAGSGAR
ncbi:MAG TPA: c-type cytochrome [Gemmatimonadaceae bacterium]|nr:c-type cytochrome [Gemmatimonadaceae bacterium]